jgi:hypothetical protein
VPFAGVGNNEPVDTELIECPIHERVEDEPRFAWGLASAFAKGWRSLGDVDPTWHRAVCC